jgi:hypothetical protein
MLVDMPDPALSEPLELSYWRRFAELHEWFPRMTPAASDQGKTDPKGAGGKLLSDRQSHRPLLSDRTSVRSLDPSPQGGASAS